VPQKNQGGGRGKNRRGRKKFEMVYMGSITRGTPMCQIGKREGKKGGGVLSERARGQGKGNAVKREEEGDRIGKGRASRIYKNLIRNKPQKTKRRKGRGKKRS